MSREHAEYLHVSSFHPQITPSRARLVRDAFGVQGWNDMKLYMRQQQMSSHPLPSMPESLTYPLASFIESIYSKGLPPGTKATISEMQFSEDYRKALSDANKAVEHLIDLYRLPQSLSGIHQEVSSTSEVVGHNLRKIYSPDFSPVVQYEMLRAHLLALTALELNHAKRIDKSQTKVSEFIDWMNVSVFSSNGLPFGSTKAVDLYSLHDVHSLWNSGDISLNESFGMADKSGFVEKKESLLVRECILDGKKYALYFNQRTKDDAKALLKAVKKAQERKGIKSDDDVVDVEDINDRIGAKVVVIEGNRDEFVQSLVKRLEVTYGTIVDDSKTNVNEQGAQLNGKQSLRHTFIRKRIPAHSNFELIVYSAQEYLNSQYDLGIINDGAAHDLYDLYRFREVADLFFPRELYPELDIELYYARALRNRENELRERNSFYYLR
jgi:hypothetical protein